MKIVGVGGWGRCRWRSLAFGGHGELRAGIGAPLPNRCDDPDSIAELDSKGLEVQSAELHEHVQFRYQLCLKDRPDSFREPIADLVEQSNNSVLFGSSGDDASSRSSDSGRRTGNSARRRSRSYRDWDIL